MKAKDETVKAELNTNDVNAKLGQIEKSLAQIRTELEDTPEQLEDDADYQAACALLVRVVKDRKWLDEQKTEFERAAKAMIKVVAALLGKGYTECDAVEIPLREKVEVYAKGLEDKAYKLRVQAAALPPTQAKKIETLLQRAETFEAPKVGGISFQNGDDVEVFDMAKLPNEFTTRVVNKKTLLAALQSGRIIPGARFIPGKTVKVTPSNSKEVA